MGQERKAIRLTRLFGGIPVAVVSDDAKRDYCLSPGAEGVIHRRDFEHWGRLPDIDDEEGFARWMKGARKFGEEFWRRLGGKRTPRIVFEHSGEDTIPTSVSLCDNAGMVVACGGTRGYDADVDLRFLWMRQKRFQGSHVASLREFDSVTRLVAGGLLNPRPFATFTLGEAHPSLLENTGVEGNGQRW
ncbi:zinc-binding dehydrogenase [Nocardiopsis sp. FIRDI 009]|uniref:zinc-binding dehydrogenase n=1 Tax=Nocardiopsis sp. FIRDI 009 TaxID=714197 RepID=UPI001E468909|nr:zinc-binding dehydrogenase [Nocardiopsis sp. FIRDI 009]